MNTNKSKPQFAATIQLISQTALAARWLGALLVITVLCAPTAIAQPKVKQAQPAQAAENARNQGHEQYADGQMQQAFASYLLGARKGDALAQYNVAMMYKSGEGVAADAKSAQYWLRKAADQKEPNACFALGTAYDDAVFGVKDLQLAKHWYECAAKEGLADAQVALATAYLSGRGVKQSDALAAKWYLTAAFQDVAEAQYIVGTMYESGTGLKKDLGSATLWYRKAAAQGDVAAKAKVQALSQ